jgi:hypothetical protein
MSGIRGSVLDKSQSTRQRITPTFFHHNIFSQDDEGRPFSVRFTPTFASTVFDC